MAGLSISQPDITLLLDLDGIIRKATFAAGMPSDESGKWVGRAWVDTVDDGVGAKVRHMLQDAQASGVSAYRTVNQRFDGGLEIPVEYSTIRLGGGAGLIAIGRNLHVVADLQNRLVTAQQAREKDYWKLREVETRYRMLFDTSSDAVLVVKADGLRVIEANLAALRALGLTSGQDFMPALPRIEHAAFHTMLERVRDQGRAPGMVVHVGIDRTAWTMRASLMSAAPDHVFLLRLAPLSAPARLRGVELEGAGLPIDDLVERLPEAFVVVNQQGALLRANPSFLHLIEAGEAGPLLGANLGRWLSRPGRDISALLALVQSSQHVRLFATILHSELGTQIAVEISAAGDVEIEPRFISLIIRDASARVAHAGAGGAGAGDAGVGDATWQGASMNVGEGRTLLAALGAMADGLGQTSLPALVKETVGLIERHYIEAALERAAGNRTATAELLGLSRQSLYMKLNRYGLDSESQADLDQKF